MLPVANADTESLKSFRTLFDTYLDHVLAKFEANRIVRNVQNCELFNKRLSFFKTIFDKSVDAILKTFLLLKQVFNGKLLI